MRGTIDMPERDARATGKDPSVSKRLAALAWPRIEDELASRGFATTGRLVTPAERSMLAGRYDDDALYRNRVVMERHGFGRGEYRYYAYPLPAIVEEFRQAAYPHLLPTANRWTEQLRIPSRFPATLDLMLERCRASGQTRPTPLLLKYGPGDYNALHQDLYGANVFPIQLAILLSEPQRDFTGGEFVLVEQRPRKQSRVHVVALSAGDGVIFSVNSRPVSGTRGYYRTTMRHGVSELGSGKRFTLGVIFHDAH